MVFHLPGVSGGRAWLRHSREIGRLWTDLAPQTRVLSALVLVFAIALTPNGQWLTWGVYGVVVAAIVLLSRVNGRDLAKRLAVEVLFVGLVLLGTLFRPGGTVVWQWGGLQVTSEGVRVLASVSIKLVLSLLVLNVLVLTTPIAHLLQALRVLRVPHLLVAILAAMHRYIGVLVAEVQDMQRAAAARNLLGHPRWRRLVLGNMIGSLFIRTLDRGEQVHRAMMARGYTGLPPLLDLPQPQRRDRWVLVALVAIALLGQVFPFLVKGS